MGALHIVRLAVNVKPGRVHFSSLAPGRALSEMAAISYRDIPARSLEEFRTLQGVRA
jgi:[acyl-carrier-protein] S-malonyltransferase